MYIDINVLCFHSTFVTMPIFPEHIFVCCIVRDSWQMILMTRFFALIFAFAVFWNRHNFGIDQIGSLDSNGVYRPN